MGEILLFENIRNLLISGRQKVLRQINSTIVGTYFEIGRMIVEDEQKGEKRAQYGNEVLKILSEKLIAEFGRGYSVQNLEYMRNFYLVYGKSQTLSGISPRLSTHNLQQTQSVRFKKRNLLPPNLPKFKLSWSHYVFLMRLDEPIRKFYEIESTQNNWSLRELKRQFDTALYERLALNRDKKKVRELSSKGQIIEKPQDLIKDPYIFEFLGLKENKSYSEDEIEEKIISNLQSFLLELGKGYTFVARQQRISFSEDHFYIDLVFYNRLLNCFVIFDIKIGKLKHQDLGQLQMYVNYYDRVIKNEEENPTVGILLCAEKNKAVVEMTLSKDSRQLFASKYALYLPTKEELIEQVRLE